MAIFIVGRLHHKAFNFQKRYRLPFYYQNKLRGDHKSNIFTASFIVKKYSYLPNFIVKSTISYQIFNKSPGIPSLAHREDLDEPVRKWISLMSAKRGGIDIWDAD